MLTPSQYKKRYESIDVLLKDGTTKPVAVNQYRLAGSNDKPHAREAFRNMLKTRGIDIELSIDTDHGTVYVDPRLTQHEDAIKKGKPDLMLSSGGLRYDYRLSGSRPTPLPWRPVRENRVDTRVLGPKDKDNDWDKLARLVFAGKGSPEACQAVLQLANHWDLAPDVQAYANSNLGLDCNGFVGNYIWHSLRGNPWTKLGAHSLDLGPDSPIARGFYDKYKKGQVNRWESLDTTKMYLFLEAGTDGTVINGGTAAATGHIVITEPNRKDDRIGDGGEKSFAVRVIESTIAHTPGLWESWYTCISVNSNFVFSINREDMVPERRQKLFKIVAVR